MLKYFNEAGGGMSNVTLSEASALFLVETAGLVVAERLGIFDSENKILVGWQADQLTDEQFGL